ncbi:alpha-amylase family glycosyl hydrolase, partial [Terracidiphilus sp.]|uniref:alpha-amylase family glycosyl hydrolase n=1 Tax=Terracidiphilus sp. TaxID=1964191 RepID=UPI003C165BE0
MNHLLLVATTLVAMGNFVAVAQEPASAADVSESARPSPDRSAPEWLRSGLIYEVFPRSFSADGNLNGVTAGLDRLKTLGVTVVWLMPIHPVGQL